MVMLLNYKQNSELIVNTMILVMTQYIYSCKSYKKIPKFIEYMTNVCELMKTERVVVNRQGKYFSHYVKWFHIITM